MKRLAVCIGVAMLLAVTACRGSFSRGEAGSLAMVPFFNEEQGYQGVVPATCKPLDPGVSDCTTLTSDYSQALISQGAYPGSMEELGDELRKDVNLDRLPEPRARYRGRALTWDLYDFEAPIVDLGSRPYRIDLAVAQGESASYFVALATLPYAYPDHKALYDSVFTHVVYSLTPMP